MRLLHNRQPDQALTYRHLLHGSAGYAHALAQAGIQPGEVVILILQHGETWPTPSSAPSCTVPSPPSCPS